MKRGNKLLVLVLAFAVVVGAYLAIDKLGIFDDKTEVDTSLKVTGTADGDITGISWSYSGEEVSLVSQDGNWTYAGDPAFPLDPSYASSMETALSSVTSARQIEMPEDLSEYGLDEPWLTITADYSVSGSKTFLLGDKNSVSSEYYMMLEGGDAVYMVDETFAKTFSYGMYDLVKYETIASMSNISGYKLETSAGVTEPEELTEDLTDAIIALKWNSCANYSATADELSKYGFDDKATATITYVGTGDSDSTNTFTLEIGSYTEDGSSAYAKLPDSNMVYLISSDVADKLMLE